MYCVGGNNQKNSLKENGLYSPLSSAKLRRLRGGLSVTEPSAFSHFYSGEHIGISIGTRKCGQINIIDYVNILGFQTRFL